MKLSDQITRRQLFVAFGTSQQTGGLSSVDLAATSDASAVTLSASDGSVAPVTGADASKAGVMTAADKVRLDGLPPTRVRDFDSFSEVPGAAVAGAITHLRTAGHASGGDGGGGLYKRAVAEPAHALKVQSADGAWWELVPEQGRIVNARQAGALGDNAANDTAAMQGILAAGYDLLVPEGTFLTDSLAPASTGQSIVGIGPKSVLKQRTATNAILDERVGTPSRLTVRGVFFQGAGGAAGAIRLENWEHVAIEGCWFDGFGTAASDWLSSPVFLSSSTDVRVVNNTSLAGNVNATGADIYIAFRVSRSVITGNILLSDCDHGVALAISGTGEEAAYHTVSNNIISKATPNSSGRHGILAIYGAKPSRTTISGNVIVGSNWTGIYIAAGGDDTDVDSASVTVTGNAIYNVAGGGASNVELYGGVVVTGNSGVTVTGNVIQECGVLTTGANHSQQCPGIRVINSCRGAAITGNHVYKCFGHAVRVYTLGFTCENIAIVGNVFRENQEDAVRIEKHSASGHQKKIRVAENIIYSAADEQGIVTNTSGGGDTVQGDFVFESNTLICDHGTPTKSGVHLVGAPSGGARVVGNHIKGYATGILLGATVGDRVIGDTVRLDRNYIDCPSAFELNVGSGAFAIVCDNEHGPAVTTRFSGTGTGGRREGRRLGANASGTGLYEVYGGAPPFAAWNAGDRSLDIAPSAGGKIGSVCVTAGSPGTWKGYGAIDA